MDAKQAADGLFPCWCLGLWVTYLVWNSDHRGLLKISKEGLLKFARFLAVATVVRVFYLSIIAPDAFIAMIRHSTQIMPWQTMFGTYWEDACQALPLVILGSMIEGKRWLKPLYFMLIAGMSITFGISHSYEGLQAMIVMSLYIPFTMRLGKKYGFGTVMICHVVYDLLTYFTFKIITGA